MPPEYLLPWVSGEPTARSRSRRLSKVKYTCTGCRTKVWGKPGLSLFCPACNQPFTPEESPRE